MVLYEHTFLVFAFFFFFFCLFVVFFFFLVLFWPRISYEGGWDSLGWGHVFWGRHVVISILIQITFASTTTKHPDWFLIPTNTISFTDEHVWIKKKRYSRLLLAQTQRDQGPVVQSVVSLTTSLRVISLTALVDSIYNILIFFAEKMWVAFALQKLLTFFQQKITAYLRITRLKF